MVKIGIYEVQVDFSYWDNYIWLERISDTELRIGLTDFAQKTLKDIIVIETPSAGQRLHKKSILFKVETISRDYEAKSPVSCIVLNTNDDVIGNPDLINEDPFKNWLVHIECLDLKDLDQLISGDDMADIILEETGGQEGEELGTEFDYESELSIESGDDDYYNDGMDKNYNADDDYGFTPSDEDW